jgi:cytoskeletal protein RodZ
MNIKKRNRKALILSLVVLAVIIAFVGAYAVFRPSTTPSSSNNSPNESLSQDTAKTDTSTETSGKPTDSNTDTPTPPKPNTSTGKSTVEMIASVDVVNGVVSIRGGINNLSTTSGSCYAMLTSPDGNTIRKDTQLLQNASTTDCKTISINTNTLAKGQWKAVLEYTSDENEGKSNEVTFAVN